ncbi:MAG: RHS repeat-associated core domain-containing protein, partial [Thermodesulfobacteriota bacterium]
AITDATSTVEWDRVYLPYGEGFNDPNSDFLSNTHEYTAKEIDEDTGLYYYGARYYKPSIGRFMSVDPAGGDITEPQSWNRYAYVQNNPFKYIDPNGEAAVNVSGIVKLNTQLRNRLGFVPDLILDLLLPVEPEAIVASSIPGPQALGTGVISKEVGKSIFNRVTTKISSLPKPDRVSNAGGFIRSFVTKEDQIFFRLFSGDNKTGRFLTKVRPKNRQQAIEGLALPSGNEAEFIQEVLVPAGTRLQRSRTLSAFGRRGGREQFELLNKIPDENFGPGVLFR